MSIVREDRTHGAGLGASVSDRVLFLVTAPCASIAVIALVPVVSNASGYDSIRVLRQLDYIRPHRKSATFR
jgi:hypothetical protein